MLYLSVAVQLQPCCLRNLTHGEQTTIRIAGVIDLKVGDARKSRSTEQAEVREAGSESQGFWSLARGSQKDPQVAKFT